MAPVHVCSTLAYPASKKSLSHLSRTTLPTCKSKQKEGKQARFSLTCIRHHTTPCTRTVPRLQLTKKAGSMIPSSEQHSKRIETSTVSDLQSTSLHLRRVLGPSQQFRQDVASASHPPRICTVFAHRAPLYRSHLRFVMPMDASLPEVVFSASKYRAARSRDGADRCAR